MKTRLLQRVLSKAACRWSYSVVSLPDWEALAIIIRNVAWQFKATTQSGIKVNGDPTSTSVSGLCCRWLECFGCREIHHFVWFPYLVGCTVDYANSIIGRLLSVILYCTKMTLHLYLWRLKLIPIPLRLSHLVLGLSLKEIDFRNNDREDQSRLLNRHGIWPPELATTTRQKIDLSACQVRYLRGYVGYVDSVGGGWRWFGDLDWLMCYQRQGFELRLLRTRMVMVVFRSWWSPIWRIVHSCGF